MKFLKKKYVNEWLPAVTLDLDPSIIIINIIVIIIPLFVVQSLTCVRLFATPWTAACQASLSFTVFQSLLKLMFIESMMPSNHLILCQPLLLISIFSTIRIFSNKLALRIRWLKYWSFSCSHSNEYSGLISFRIDWFDLFAIQGPLKSLLRNHSISIIWEHQCISYHWLFRSWGWEKYPLTVDSL